MARWPPEVALVCASFRSLKDGKATRGTSLSSMSIAFSGSEVWQVQLELGRVDRSQPTAFVHC